MASMAQLRGMLLEEVVLALLRKSGFDPIENPGNDRTLSIGPAGLRVQGRGSTHQADALADFRIVMPFGNPTRLIVEAKFLDHNKTGLGVIRNAVGVRKDIEEFFVPSTSPEVPPRVRFHYQYAVFSATDFTLNAQRYAYAHDVYLFPLARSRHMRGIVDIIRSLEPAHSPSVSNAAVPVDLGALRRRVRKALRDGVLFDLEALLVDYHDLRRIISALIDATWSLGGTLLARANRQFPLHLVPTSQQALRKASKAASTRVRIFYDESSWYLRHAHTNEDLFSFDLPEELFSLYANSGALTARAALDLKERELSRIEALYSDDESTRYLTFVLDQPWLDEVRQAIEGRRKSRRA
jgi:hypothetical protein